LFAIRDIDESQMNIIEQIGSKEKFWIDDGEWLYKVSRPGCGEHWAEKLAEAVALTLGIPCAQYELAKFAGQFGVISRNLAPHGSNLWLGNDAMQMLSPLRSRTRGSRVMSKFINDSSQRIHRVYRHTVPRVIELLGPPVEAPHCYQEEGEATSARHVFVGYLMFDCLIGNQDRHEENWGVILAPGNPMRLAPTFDHGAAFARNITDEERKARLTTKDLGRSVQHFAARASSGFFADDQGSKRIKAIEAFELAASLVPGSGKYWLGKLEHVPEASLLDGIERLPSSVISDVARDFARVLTLTNRVRLLNSQSAR